MKFEVGDKVRIKPELFTLDEAIKKHKVKNQTHTIDGITKYPQKMHFLKEGKGLIFYEENLIGINNTEKIKKLMERLK